MKTIKPIITGKGWSFAGVIWYSNDYQCLNKYRTGDSSSNIYVVKTNKGNEKIINEELNDE